MSVPFSDYSNSILILGSKGQVGHALLSEIGKRATGLDVPEINFMETEALEKTLKPFHPSALINAAAYTQVDQAEKEPELLERINVQAPAFLARWCSERDIPFIHYSTDYVFSGEGEIPWSEEDPTAPLNAYGRSKLRSEQEIKKIGGKWLIFRSSWIYDSDGNNFLTKMLNLGKEQETLRIVSDQVGAPTFAPDLALGTIRALENVQEVPVFPSGIYHLCHSGQTSWYGFAQAIFENAKSKGLPLKVKTLEPISTKDYPTAARRPLNSRLNTQKAQTVLDVRLPNWQLGLVNCMETVK